MSPENGNRRVEGLQAGLAQVRKGIFLLEAGLLKIWFRSPWVSSSFPQTGWNQSQKQALHSAALRVGALANSSPGAKRKAGSRRDADRGWKGRRPGSETAKHSETRQRFFSGGQGQPNPGLRTGRTQTSSSKCLKPMGL